MITKVVLKNWRTHLDTEINFSEGTNCFVGHMGSGKTSIIDAVCFGLFGTFLQLQQKKLRLEDVIMKKPQSMDRAEVTVFFDVGDEAEWNVKRVVTKGRSTAELRKNSELVEGPQPTKVNDEIEKLLKMNYDLFSRAVYSEQNQLDMFLTIPKGQRMRKIDELLAIDKFEKARSNTRSLINKSLTVLSEKENVVQSLESDESLRRIDAIRRDLQETAEKQEKVRIQLNEIVSKKNDMERDMFKMKEQQAKLRSIDEDVKKFMALIDLLDADIEKLKNELVEFAEVTDEDLQKEMKKCEQEAAVLEASLDDEKKSLRALIESYAEDNAQINLLEKERIPRLEKMSREFDEISESLKKSPAKKLRAEYEKSKKDLDDIKESMQALVAKLSQTEEGLADLESVEGSCPICDSKMTPDKKEKLIEKKKKAIKDYRKGIDDCKKSIEKMKASLPAMEREIRQAERMEEKIDELRDSGKDLREMQTRLKAFKAKSGVFENQKKMFDKNIGMIETNLSVVKEKQERVRQVLSKKEDADRKIEKIREYKQSISFLESERSLLASYSPAILEKYEADYRSLISLEGGIQANLMNASDTVSSKQKLLEEVEGKKKMLDDYVTEMRGMAAIADQLRMLESALESTQEQLRKDFVSAVNDAMQSIWTELYPYKDIYGIRIGIEEGDYVLQLQDSTGWIAADGVASGGERSLACLALRIAFSLVMAPQFRMLVLDEPTANLDSQAVDILADVLRERITLLVEQCFLVTHDDKLKEAVSGYCYEFTRDKSKDSYTTVGLVSSPTQI